MRLILISIMILAMLFPASVIAEGSEYVTWLNNEKTKLICLGGKLGIRVTNVKLMGQNGVFFMYDGKRHYYNGSFTVIEN